MAASNSYLRLKNAVSKGTSLAVRKMTSGDPATSCDIFRLIIDNLLNVVSQYSETWDGWEIVESDEEIVSEKVSEKTVTAEESSHHNRKNADATQKLKTKIEQCVVHFEKPLAWEQVIGQSEAKEALREALVYPFQYPWFFQNGVVRPQGILLYGPPGVAKSKLAEVAGSQVQAPFLMVKASDIRAKWSGEAEKMVQALFDKVREYGKAVIFIDEIDGLLPARGTNDKRGSDGVVNQFLLNIRGISSNDEQWFVIIGATNYPQNIDSAILRRFQRIIPLTLPSVGERYELFELFLKPAQTFHVDELQEFAKKTKGFSGSDIQVIVQDALLQPLRIAVKEQSNVAEGSLKEPSKDDVMKAIKRKDKTVTIEILQQLKAFQKSHNVLRQNKQEDVVSTNKARRLRKIAMWF